MEATDPRVVALVLDLMFASRVRGVASEAAIVRSAEGVLDAVGPETRLVLVDLQADGALDAIRGLAGRGEETRVVAWGPHVMEDALAAAEEAGADDVMARGAFVKALSGLVAEATQS